MDRTDVITILSGHLFTYIVVRFEKPSQSVKCLLLDMC